MASEKIKASAVVIAAVFTYIKPFKNATTLRPSALRA